MSEMVERCLMVMDEIWAKEPIPFDDREEMVRAVIGRLREPTEEMTVDADARYIWQGMIDEALK